MEPKERELAMIESMMDRWAGVLVNYSVGVQPGEVVAVSGGTAAEPLLRAVYRAVVQAGGSPVLIPTISGLNTTLLAEGSDEQLRYVSPLERFAAEHANASIAIGAETNTKSNSAIDPMRQRIFQTARADVRKTFMARAASGSLRWASTLYPTDAYAQDAEMSTEAFAQFIFNACKLDEPDPAASWRVLRDEQQRLIDWLSDKGEVRIVAPDTDLSLSTKGRTWINSDGHRNFPSGEIFTGPIEDSVNGHIRFSYPVVTAGREVHDIRLTFENGKVVDVSAAREENYLIQTLDSDAGARFVGEFAFGTNFNISRFTKNMLLDEKIGGTLHMALGAGYPDSGSKNHSAIHWDMICDVRSGGTVTIDGLPFLKDGKYLI
jgi:aminopeptidase